MDDEPDIREAVQMSLSLVDNLDVHTCESGERALARAAGVASGSRAARCDDARVWTGPRRCRRFATMAGFETMPVIFMTAKAMPQEVARFRELGAARGHRQAVRSDQARESSRVRVGRAYRCVTKTSCASTWRVSARAISRARSASCGQVGELLAEVESRALLTALKELERAGSQDSRQQRHVRISGAEHAGGRGRAHRRTSRRASGPGALARVGEDGVAAAFVGVRRAARSGAARATGTEFRSRSECRLKFCASSDVGWDTLRELLEPYALTVDALADATQIPGPYWGESEAGARREIRCTRARTHRCIRCCTRPRISFAWIGSGASSSDQDAGGDHRRRERRVLPADRVVG